MIDERRTQKYTKFLEQVRRVDEEVYRFLLQNVRSCDYDAMMKRLASERPELHRKLASSLEEPGGKAGPKAARTATEPQDALRDVYLELKKNYSCKDGFAVEGPQRRTVTIRMKGDQPVIGLPTAFINLQKKAILDVGAKKHWTFSFDNRVTIAKMTDDEIEELKKNPLIESVEDEPEARIMGTGRIPIPPYDPEVENTDWGVTKIAPQYAWDKGIKGQGIKLCIVDTGVQSTHPDITARFRGGYNFINGNDNPADDMDHGTYCAGIACGDENGSGYKGVAPQAELYACKVLNAKGGGTLNDVAAGIDWCVVNGMHIVSLSLGASSGSSILENSCNNAWTNGLILLAAAGNYVDPDHPGARAPENSVMYPAKYLACVAVAAIDHEENVAYYSCRGPEIEVSAPGSWVVGPLAGFTYNRSPDDYRIDNSEIYMVASGTSAATPHVAGAAALIKCWYPDATNLQIRQWLIDHCIDL